MKRRRGQRLRLKPTGLPVKKRACGRPADSLGSDDSVGFGDGSRQQASRKAEILWHGDDVGFVIKEAMFHRRNRLMERPGAPLRRQSGSEQDLELSRVHNP